MLEEDDARGKEIPVEILTNNGTDDARVLQLFRSVADSVYQEDPVWSPASEMMWEQRFRGLQGHPDVFVTLLVALEGGLPVARCMPMLVPGAVDENGNPQGWIGFFEYLRGYPGAAQTMLTNAEALLHQVNARSVVMPKSDNLLVGLLTSGFDLPHFVFTNHNPEYYLALLKSCGYHPKTRMVTYNFARSKAKEFHLKLPHLKTREFDREDLDHEIEVFHYLQKRIFERRPGYVARSFQEDYQLVQSFLPFLEDEFVIIAETPGGDPVGLLVCIPDIYQGHLHGTIDRARIMSIGAIPEYRNKGVGVLMGVHLMGNLIKNPRYMSVEGSVIQGQNIPVHNLVKRFGAQTGKEYWLLEKALP